MTLTPGQSFTSLPTSPTSGEYTGLGQEEHRWDTEAGSAVQMSAMAPCLMAGGILGCSEGVWQLQGPWQNLGEEEFGSISPYMRRMGSCTHVAIKHMLKEKSHQ